MQEKKNNKKINLPKVLIAAPQSDKKNYCFDLWYQNVINFSYPNTEIFLADNSDTNHNYKKLLSLGIKSEYIKQRGKGIIERMTLSHESLRNYAIRNKFDYIFHLETDIICPTDTIERLLLHRKPVIGATYYIGGHGKTERRLMVQSMEDCQMSFRHSNFQTESFCDGTVKPILSVGLGCTLINKSVFEKIPFRWVKNDPSHPDTFFAADLAQYQIQNYVDTSIFCKHHNQQWGEYGIDFK